MKAAIKSLALAGLAALMAMPGTAWAQAQATQWEYADGNGTNRDCFAMTFSGPAAFAFQGPSRGGGNEGVFAVMAADGAIPRDDEVTIAFDVEGQWAGAHDMRAQHSDDVLTFLLPLESFGDIDALPDSFHVRIGSTTTVLIDLNVTGFKAAVAEVRRCIAARS